MRDRIELRRSCGRPCREGFDAGVVLLSWGMIVAVAAPMAMGCLSLAAPATFAAWFGPPGPIAKASPR